MDLKVAVESVRASFVMIRHRFIVLLLTLILLLLAVPALTAMEDRAQIVFNIVFVGMLMGAVFAVSENRTQLIVAGCLAGAQFVLRVLTPWLELEGLQVAQMLLGILFLGYIAIVIVRYLFSTERVTFDMICASLCVYLLLGIIWYEAYVLLAVYDSESFKMPERDVAEMSASETNDAQGDLVLYFSFVTLTTLGYGDVTPVTATARMLAILEAITGQLYLVVLVGRLVGLQISQSTRRRDSP